MFDIPQSEMCILAAIMMNPGCLKQIRLELKPSDFSMNKHQAIFEAILEVDQAGLPMLPTSIVDCLQAKKKTVDGEYLGEILSNIHTSAGVGYHVNRVKTNRIKAALLEVSSRIADNVNKGNAVELLQKTKDQISNIRPPVEIQTIQTLSDVLPGVVDSIDQKESNSITTGLSALDNLITGWHPGDLIIVAGRPGMGKSILAKDFAEAAGIPVLFFSLEMPTSQLVKRQIAAHSGISYTSIRKSRVSADDWPRIKEAADRLYRLPIAFSDRGNMSVSEIVATCEARKRKEGLGMVVIDYLQLIRADGKLEHREREIAQISQRLKILARDLNIPVICLAQLNRACEARGGQKKPMLSDLRESGSIEQDADTVIFIWREAMYFTTENPHEALLIVAKGRNTETGAVKVFFDGKYQRFGNLDTWSEGNGSEGPE